jgi:hypothetical protein
MYYCNGTWSNMSLLWLDDEPEEASIRLGDLGGPYRIWSSCHIYCFPDLSRAVA